MATRIVETRPSKLRLVLPVKGQNKALVVKDDPELIFDSDYAPGVNEDLKKAWDNDDYFVVYLVDHNGDMIDSVSSMAGHGSPRRAAEDALLNYWKR